MKLRAFETFGFKSFAEKTELTFDKGITAIVGPNGSGKSNISDAIRWVLGEQSAKYLRGGKMEDVIFSGTAKRRALGLAEVNLYFDNTDHQLALDFDEVSITRRLYRSGDSDYLINKKPVRLKDVVDLMADTGLGKGSMSIVGQNKIDEILNARPEERRTIFEEAAGIAKFRMRKKDAMRKMDETTQNLVRISDIKVEIENQVAPLKEEAEKTTHYNELIAQQKQVRLTKFMRQIDGVNEIRQKLLQKQESLKAELVEKTSILANKESVVSELQLDMDKLTEEYAELQSCISDKETAIERIKGDLKVLQEREEFGKKQCARLEANIANLENQILGNKDIVSKLANDFDKDESVIVELAQKIEIKKKEKNDAQQRYDNAVNEQNNAQNLYFKGMQELITLQTELEALEKDQEERVKKREGLKEIIDKLENQTKEIDNKGRDAADVLARVELDRDRYTSEVNGLENVLLEQNSEVQKLREGKSEAERCLTMNETRLSSLIKMQESYEGFGNGIKTTLNSNESWTNNIIGVVAKLIKVEPKFVTAIEVALGDGAQNIVTVNADTAKHAINYLKRENAGRATFLPLDTISPRPLEKNEQELANLSGVLGFAFDLIKFDLRAEKALKFLLGRVLVVENMDVALNAAKAGKFRFRIVTLDGDIVNAGGSLTGGARRNREGYLSREKNIKELQVVIDRMSNDILTWQEKLEKAEEKVNETIRQEKDLRNKVSAADLRVKELQMEIANWVRQKRELDQRLQISIGDRTEAASQYMAQRERVRVLRDTLAQRQQDDHGASMALEELKEKINREGINVKNLDGQLMELCSQKDNIQNRKDYTEQRMKDIDNQQIKLQENIQKNEEEQENLRKEDIERAKEREKLNAQFEQMMLDLGSSSSDREKFEIAKAEVKEKHERAEQEAMEARKIVAMTDGKVHQSDMELVKQNTEYEHALEQLQMEYHMTVEEARNANLLDDNDRDLAKKDRQLTMSIVELGSVDPGAVEKYNSVKQRAELYQKQYDDLIAAKDKLESVIAEINSGMGKRFKDAFAEINLYFAQCYKDLFGGGTALLKLSNPEDILESGIEIEAQPPGKKLQGLFLLSGGERALTVIALLFALLSYKPSPFCILDEIDAPLDDSNIGRFSNFLHSYAQKTQFIVITHRKGTMEAADIMYGVTMEESGVSKLLSVKISDGTEEKGVSA